MLWRVHVETTIVGNGYGTLISFGDDTHPKHQSKRFAGKLVLEQSARSFTEKE